MKLLNKFVQKVVFLTGVLASASAFAGANPSIGWNFGTITATPHYPIVGESTHIAVVVTNPGDAPANNVQVKLSFNDWGVTFQGWQEIATVTVASIPAGGSTLAEADYVFQHRTHTCLEALVVGASENTNPDDDRGQINLEVINAGETFTWNVPVVNNGNDPLHLLLVGGCRGKGEAGGNTVPPPCKDDVKEVNVAPGEELLVPIEIDLHGFAVGQQLEFELNAYNLGAGPGSFLPQNHNHVLIRVTRETARHLIKSARDRANALAATQTNRGLKRRLELLGDTLDKTLIPALWLDDNKVRKVLGVTVFALTQAAVLEIDSLLNGNVSHNDKIVLDELARNLSDADRILAKAVNGDADDIKDGDDDRANGNYARAINDYKHAWLSCH